MIRVQGLSKQAGATRILDGLSLHVAEGGFVALLGPSGSGKTTLLRVIAGLEHADSGTLHLAGRPAHDLPPGRRGLGFVFQGYALFEHMTVARNIAFGLHVRRPRPPRRQITETVERMLALVRLPGLGDRLPSQLSGGQRQRVALARTLAVKPRILLLDEPFGALDRQVREELRGELRRIHDALGTTTLFVTHDHEEAMALADRALVLDRGRLVAEHAGHGRPAPGAVPAHAPHTFQERPPRPLGSPRPLFET